MNKIENLEEIVFQVDSKDKIGITVSEIYLKLREVIDHLNTTPTDSQVEELVQKYYIDYHIGIEKLDKLDFINFLRSFAKELLNL